MSRLHTVLALLLLLAGAAVPAVAQKELTRADLIQPFLSDELAHWMVGPIWHMATDAEIDRWASLNDDDEARKFITEFWQAREEPGQDPSLLELFEGRARHADNEYTEGHVQGRRTDRGTVYILYGPPASVEYEEFRDVSEPEVELWKYPKKAEPGLDGEKPRREYRFARQGDLTRQYRPPSRDELRRRARMRNPYP